MLMYRLTSISLNVYCRVYGYMYDDVYLDVCMMMPMLMSECSRLCCCVSWGIRVAAYVDECVCVFVDVYLEARTLMPMLINLCSCLCLCQSWWWMYTAVYLDARIPASILMYARRHILFLSCNAAVHVLTATFVQDVMFRASLHEFTLTTYSMTRP